MYSCWWYWIATVNRGCRVTLTRVCSVTTSMHSQLHIIWREQAQLSCVDERVTVADARSTVSRLSAFTASSGQCLQHVQKLFAAACCQNKISTRKNRVIFLLRSESVSGLWSRKSQHPTPSHFSEPFPTPTPPPTPERLWPFSVLIT